MLLAIWTLRLFYLLIVAMGLVLIMLPGADGLAVTVVPIVLIVAGLIEFIIQALLRLEKWAWWAALLICALLICSLWFTLFGLFGVWGLLAAQPRLDAARGESFNMMTTWRPAGVNITATAQLLLGLLSLMGVTLIRPLASQRNIEGDPSALRLWSFMLAIAVLSLCMACGIYFLQRWAWYGALITQTVAFFGLANFIFMGESSLILHLCFSLIAAGYLLDPNVKHALRH